MWGYISELKADVERMRARQGLPREGPGSPSSNGVPPRLQASAASEEQGGPMAGAKEALDKLLIADFFLVLFILAWLAAGVAQSGLNGGSSPLLDAWYPLWPLLWQPALGVLMAGALVSGGIGWVAEQQAKRR
ncbi:hypothetical protein TSOC_012537 [Tetrabaena socialis]|uniref:Uncharacterized protein n=1 Tax=Tetrabaena socialis TaxID=47790 RepID=A0A2J7ZMS3_9CHLO|nr:hypothetical protein TSOC_012537 [Tetrabaena socialis]|eukprot:PNH01569.1 hypothetical protein TSOC_012537 [Tetrabaena socialis]